MHGLTMSDNIQLFFGVMRIVVVVVVAVDPCRRHGHDSPNGSFGGNGSDAGGGGDGSSSSG